MGIERADPDPEVEVRRDSDELLEAVRELHDLEAEKRKEEISSQGFHDAARKITERSRDIFRRAAEEERHGNEIEDPSHATTEDVPPGDGDGRT